MIVDNLYLHALLVSPVEANTPLVVNPNAVLASAATLERFKAIRWRNSQVIKSLSGIEHAQFAAGNGLNLNWQPPRYFAVPNALGFLVGEGPDHDAL